VVTASSIRRRSADHFAGLDVSVKETSVCILDDAGKIVKEVKVASEPQALLKVLGNPAYRFKRIGLEAGPLSQWLFSALAEAELPVISVETRHVQAVLKAQINKTDRNDARGIAQMMRVGVYRPCMSSRYVWELFRQHRPISDRSLSPGRPFPWGELPLPSNRPNETIVALAK
jgi:transposase